MDRLTLPPPASGLWALAADELHRILRFLPHPPPRYRIGGGTVLAARWRHRASTDIDLTVPAGSGLNTLVHDAEADVRARMTKIGTVEPLLATRHYRIEFRQGTIEITESDPRPGVGHAAVEYGRRTVDALSTTQILRGKLKRSLDREPPARDLFDFAVAEAEDPRALREAVNMLAPDQQRQVAAHWENAEHRISIQAPHEIQVFRPEYRSLVRSLTKRGLVLLKNARYLRTAIHRTGDDVHITTTTRTRTDTTHTSPDRLEAALQATGLQTFFENHPPGPRTISARIRAAMHRGTAAATILTGGEAGPGLAPPSADRRQE